MGAEIGSDHELLIAKLKVKIARVRNARCNTTPRFDTSKIQTLQVKQEFSLTLNNRYAALANLNDGTIEKQWEQVRDTFTSVCEDKLGFRKHTYKTWLSNNTVKKIEDKRAVRQKLLNARTRAQSQTFHSEYSVLQKEVKKSCRQDKRKQVDNLATLAEAATVQHDLGTLYQITRQLLGRKNYPNKPV